MAFVLSRVPGNDYATDLYDERKYYRQLLDAYAATDAPDHDSLLKLSETVGEIEKEWAAYLAMLENRRSPDRLCL